MKNDNLHQNRNEAKAPENPTSGHQELTEGMTEDALIDAVAAQVLAKYRVAFEDLAK